MDAQIWILSGPGGTATRFSDKINDETFHHRHGTWSADRTQIAYAQGVVAADNFAGPWTIWLDNVDGTGAANITSGGGAEDRPSFSPDGTRIAYAQFDADQLGHHRPNGERPERRRRGKGRRGHRHRRPRSSGRPAWSADSTKIYYGRLVGANNHDIYSSTAAGGQTAGQVVTTSAGADNDYQPAVSPDGTRLCFTREVDGTTKDVRSVPAAGSTATTAVAATAGRQNYECA